MSRTRLPIVAALMAACTVLPSQAQQVFRIVGPDGKVTFSDKPPSEPNAKAGPAPVVNMAAAASVAGLPYELRTVAGKYPVTFYSGPSCGPCGAARAYLQGRGIPFVEKTVATGDDVAALQRLSGSNALPFLTIGSQQLQGYSDAEWGQFLDAAGYPKSSQLPASYRYPSPTPLVAAAPAAAPAQAGANGGAAGEEPIQTVNPRARARSNAPAPAPAAAPANPAGIQF
jgi:glutaredoxin